MKYLLNGFLLLIPIFIWNIIFVKSLPEAYSPEIFWKDIPAPVKISENILRIMAFFLPLLIHLSLKSPIQKLGFGIYILGIIIYFLSWIAQIYFTQSIWSTSMAGFMAPAYTTIIWFAGIALMAGKTYIQIPNFGIIYLLLAIAFVFVHSLHTYIVYQRL